MYSVLLCLGLTEHLSPGSKWIASDFCCRLCQVLEDGDLPSGLDGRRLSGRGGSDEVDGSELEHLRSRLAEADGTISSLRGQLTDAQRWNETLQSRMNDEKSLSDQVSIDLLP